METGDVWSLHATSTDHKRLFESFRKFYTEDQIQPSFAICLLSAIHCNKIVDEINLLSKREIVLQTNLSSQAGHAMSEPIYVWEVEVCCTQGTLKVHEKDAAKKDAFFHPNSKNLVRVIWIYSKSVNVVDAKLTVFMNYESYLREHNIYIHHALEDADNVILFFAYKQVNSLLRVIESISDGFPFMNMDTILQEASEKTLSRYSIRQVCYNIFLWDKNVDVGRVDNASYNCRLVFTVRRLKEQLVEKTLNETAKAFRSEICRGVLKHIESNILTNLDENFSDLRLKISDELFATITSVVVFAVIFGFINPLLGIIVAVGYVVVTFIWSVNVNSTDWREAIADEIYETIVKNKTDIFHKIKGQVEKVCGHAQRELYEVSDTVADFKRHLGQLDQNILVLEWKERDRFKNIFQKHPSVLTYLAGTRDGSPVVKVFLNDDYRKYDELLQLSERYPGTHFVFVDVDTGCEDISKNMEKIEIFERSAPEIDKETREKMNKVIRRHTEILFANHSSIIGIKKSNVRSHHDKMRNEFCIVLLCLDKSIIPYGELPLPKNLDGYPCDIREDFVMFGHCLGCQTLNIGCSIGIPLIQSAGSVGFFVRSNDSTQGISKSGFLTAAHLAIEQCDELYEHKSLLSTTHLSNMSHKIVHPSYADNAANVVIGEVIESFFGNYGTNEIGIDAAFVQTNQQNLGGKCMSFFAFFFLNVTQVFMVFFFSQIILNL